MATPGVVGAEAATAAAAALTVQGSLPPALIKLVTLTFRMRPPSS